MTTTEHTTTTAATTVTCTDCTGAGRVEVPALEGLRCAHCNALGVIKGRFTKSTFIYASEQAANIATKNGTSRVCLPCAGTGTVYSKLVDCGGCDARGYTVVAEPIVVPAASAAVWALWDELGMSRSQREATFEARLTGRTLVRTGADEDGLDLL